jgi:ABC-type transport system involved in cytochrome c biogenesis permease subunit
MLFEHVSVLCFAASYALAWTAELAYLIRPRPVLWVIGLCLGSAGLFAHSLFLIHGLLRTEHGSPLVTPFGSLLCVAWILAIFYLYGSVHHHKQAWAVFVLPLVLGLIGLASLFQPGPGDNSSPDWLRGERFLGLLHGALLLLAAVGVCVGFVASVMYLIQAQRLRAKALPGKGVRLLSLERLEAMNRRAIVTSFPLLTAGVVVGIVLMVLRASDVSGWTDPRILGSVVLWIVFALLVYLRYGLHLRPRRVAVLTIVTFLLLVCTLVTSHTIVQGGQP